MRVIDRIMATVFIICLVSVGAYWTRRIILLPDAAELATKDDVRAVKATVVDRSMAEETKRMAVASEDKKRHDDLMKRLKSFKQQQRENTSAIEALEAQLRRER